MSGRPSDDTTGTHVTPMPHHAPSRQSSSRRAPRAAERFVVGRAEVTLPPLKPFDELDSHDRAAITRRVGGLLVRMLRADLAACHVPRSNSTGVAKVADTPMNSPVGGAGASDPHPKGES